MPAFRGPLFFCSNFYPCRVVIGAIAYPSSEHAFAAMKTEDPEEWVKIAALATPDEAKAYGRRVDLRDDWETYKLQAMEIVLRAKFEQNPRLMQALKATTQPLVETNEWGDTFWGVCRGVGQNHLGKLLMKIRDETS